MNLNFNEYENKMMAKMVKLLNETHVFVSDCSFDLDDFQIVKKSWLGNKVLFSGNSLEELYNSVKAYRDRRCGNE